MGAELESVIDRLQIPEGFRFEDLDVSRDPVTQQLHSRTEGLEVVLLYNRIPVHLFREKPYFKILLACALTEAYRAHLEHGGEPNPAMDLFEKKS